MDYNFDDTFQLIFEPEDNQLSIPFSTLEDLIVERSEVFSFVLSVPENPVSDYSVLPGAATVVINIDDNDGEKEQDRYVILYTCTSS